VQCPSNNFFLDFDANPLKKTVNMHSSAWAWTFTRIK
jgi:hypothetical protein